MRVVINHLATNIARKCPAVGARHFIALSIFERLLDLMFVMTFRVLTPLSFIKADIDKSAPKPLQLRNSRTFVALRAITHECLRY